MLDRTRYMDVALAVLTEHSLPRKWQTVFGETFARRASSAWLIPAFLNRAMI